MSEASIWCVSCERYKRPQCFSSRRIHKVHRAPDGGPSGYCRSCKKAYERRCYAEMKADAERSAAWRARQSAYGKRRYAAMTVEERRADARRRRARVDPEKRRARERRYRAKHREVILAQERRKRERVKADPARYEHYRAKWREQWRTNGRVRCYERRLAALGVRVAALRGGAS